MTACIRGNANRCQVDYSIAGTDTTTPDTFEVGGTTDNSETTECTTPALHINQAMVGTVQTTVAAVWLNLPYFKSQLHYFLFLLKWFSLLKMLTDCSLKFSAFWKKGSRSHQDSTAVCEHKITPFFFGQPWLLIFHIKKKFLKISHQCWPFKNSQLSPNSQTIQHKSSARPQCTSTRCPALLLLLTPKNPTVQCN